MRTTVPNRTPLAILTSRVSQLHLESSLYHTIHLSDRVSRKKGQEPASRSLTTLRRSLNPIGQRASRTSSGGEPKCLHPRPTVKSYTDNIRSGSDSNPSIPPIPGEGQLLKSTKLVETTPRTSAKIQTKAAGASHSETSAGMDTGHGFLESGGLETIVEGIGVTDGDRTRIARSTTGGSAIELPPT